MTYRQDPSGCLKHPGPGPRAITGAGVRSDVEAAMLPATMPTTTAVAIGWRSMVAQPVKLIRARVRRAFMISESILCEAPSWGVLVITHRMPKISPSAIVPAARNAGSVTAMRNKG